MGVGHQSHGSPRALNADWRGLGTEGRSGSDSGLSPWHQWKVWQRRWREGAERG